MDQIIGNGPKGLVYVGDSEPGIRRQRSGRGFCYRLPDGALLRDPDEKNRINALAIPPAYRDVWICSDERGHLQATGLDDRSRKQYRYHPEWSEFRNQLKFAGLAEFGEALPRIRRRVRADLRAEAGELEFTLAAIVALADAAALRPGSRSAASENRTFGATTLLKRHLKLDDDGIRLDYRAKGGKRVRMSLKQRRLHQILEKISDLPGRRLFQWRDANDTLRPVESGQVNAYLAEISGGSHSFKTFRTWAGTLAAFEAGTGSFENGEKTSIKAMASASAEVLHNTAAVSRTSYVHPRIFELAALKPDDGRDLAKKMRGIAPISELRIGEARLLDFLKS